MISRYDLIKKLKENKVDGFHYDENTDSVVRNADNESFNIDLVLDKYRKNTGQSFDTIYDFHAYNMEILKCTECGTVVRYFCDENYDPNFRCPTCNNYDTHFEYWSKDQIDNDSELQEMIKMYEKMAIDDRARYSRIKIRCGLQDWELAKRTIHLKNIGFVVTFDIASITNKNKLKGLSLKIEKLNKDGNGWVYGKRVTIPLSFSQLYYQLYYKNYLKKHPEENPFEQLKGRPLYESMEAAKKFSINKKVLK